MHSIGVSVHTAGRMHSIGELLYAIFIERYFFHTPSSVTLPWGKRLYKNICMLFSHNGANRWPIRRCKIHSASCKKADVIRTFLRKCEYVVSYLHI